MPSLPWRSTKGAVSSTKPLEKQSTEQIISQDRRRSSVTASLSRLQERSTAVIARRKFSRVSAVGGDNLELSPFGQLFFGLPTELIVEVLLHLPIPTILSFRRISRLCNELVSRNESIIVRQCLTQKLPKYWMDIYHFPDPTAEYDIRALCVAAHRYSASCRLASTLADFVQNEWMRCTTTKARKSFRHDRELLRKELAPPLLTLYHCFERRRNCVFEAHKHKLQAQRPSEGLCTAINDWKRTDYSDDAILQALYTLELLITAMGRLLRPPSYATILERSLRGWMWEPASRDEIMQLINEGGIDQTGTVLKQSPYATRRQAQATFLKQLQSGVAKRRDVWVSLLYGPFPLSSDETYPERFWETADSMPTTEPVSRCLWDRAQELEEYEESWTIPKTYVSNILGYDIVERLRQSQTLQEQVEGRRFTEQDLEELRIADEVLIKQSLHGGLDPWWVDYQDFS